MKAVSPNNFTSHNIPAKFVYPLQNNDERRECMNWGIVCGQTPILDFAAGNRGHFATKGYKEKNLMSHEAFTRWQTVL